MASTHSYTATLGNNQTEAGAIDFLLAADPRFKRPTLAERKEVLRLLELSKSFSRAFDLVYMPEGKDNILVLKPEDLVLVELKTTKKKLVNLPYGFFFGATDNEFQLARKLGDKYKFCFISLHPESAQYSLQSLEELEKLIRVRRLQYQINL